MTPTLPPNPDVLCDIDGIRIMREGVLVYRQVERVRLIADRTLNGPLLPEGVEIGADDVDRLERFLLDAFPPDGENYRTHGHLQLTSQVAAELAARTGRNSHEFAVLGYLHDLGRLIADRGRINSHRYARNDLVGTSVQRMLRVPKALQDKLQPLDTYFHPERYLTADAFTEDQILVMMADLLGKRCDDASARVLIGEPADDKGYAAESVLAYHYASRGKLSVTQPGPWPSENAAKRVTTPDVVDQWGHLYEQGAAMLRDRYGIDVDEVQATVLAREAAAPKDTVIFDIGGVLIDYADEPIVADFCRELNVDETTLMRAWTGKDGDEQKQPSIIGQLQTGDLDEDTFWTELGKRLGREIPADKRDLFTRSFTPQLRPGMRDLIARLRARGITTAVLSDTVPPHVRALRDAGTLDGFAAEMVSPDIRASKKDGSRFQPSSKLAAFRIAALRLRRPVQACVFIDDRAPLATAARDAAMGGIHYTSQAQTDAELAGMGLL